MKKIFGFILSFVLVSTNAFAVADWDKTSPATSSNAADIGVNITQTNNEALDRLVGSYRRDCTNVPSTTTAFNVLAGEIAIPNSDASVVRWRKNTSTVPVSSANIDAGGAFSNSTQYYTYAVGDATATTFTVKVSTSSTAPSGTTYYRKIGYFYIDGSGNIVSVGNIKGGDASNVISISSSTQVSTSSTSLTDDTSATLYFYSSGHPVEITYSASMANSSTSETDYGISIDGSDVTPTLSGILGSSSSTTYLSASNSYFAILSTGLHTIKGRFKVGAATGYINSRIINAEEL